jgi:hypothetical protein
MPHIANALEGLLVKSVWLDGEVVVIRSVERAASGQ